MHAEALPPYRQQCYKPCLLGTVVAVLTGLLMALLWLFNPVLAIVFTAAGLVGAAALMRNWSCSKCGEPLRHQNTPACPKCSAVFQG